MWKIQYKSLLSGSWVDSYHGNFSTERRALNAAKELIGYEVRIVPA